MRKPATDSLQNKTLHPFFFFKCGKIHKHAFQRMSVKFSGQQQNIGQDLTKMAPQNFKLQNIQRGKH